MLRHRGRYRRRRRSLHLGYFALVARMTRKDVSNENVIDGLLDVLEMIKDAATERRGDDFNLSSEQWARVHSAIMRARDQRRGDEAATIDTERARLVAEVGQCCEGADPYCVGGCLVQAAIRRRQESRGHG
jgi:hypothetical protein